VAKFRNYCILKVIQSFPSVQGLQEAQLSLTNRAMVFCKVVEVLQDFLSENVDNKFTTQVPNYYSAFGTIILLRFYN